MARIAMGLPAKGYGHLNQALSLACGMPEHDFLFLRGSAAPPLESAGYMVRRIPSVNIAYRNHRVDVPRTFMSGISNLLLLRRRARRVAETLAEFRPDLVISSFEVYTPMAAKTLGIPSVHLDHQHVISHCEHPFSVGTRRERLSFLGPLRRWYSRADAFIAQSFAPAKVLDLNNTRLFRSLISNDVMERRHAVSSGEHITVYQTSSTFENLVQTLAGMPFESRVYGFGERKRLGSVVFRPPDRRAFADDLASCRYFVANGGHTGMSEALFLNKPVLSFPIHGAYEQRFNAEMLRFHGWGDYSMTREPTKEVFTDFEQRLESYRESMRDQQFCGNEKLIEFLRSLIARMDDDKPFSQAWLGA